MKKDDNNMTNESDDLRAEYDIDKVKSAVRGKYADDYADGTNVVLLDPDVAEAFPTGDSVNTALRLLIQIAERRTSEQAE